MRTRKESEAKLGLIHPCLPPSLPTPTLLEQKGLITSKDTGYLERNTPRSPPNSLVTASAFVPHKLPSGAHDVEPADPIGAADGVHGGGKAAEVVAYDDDEVAEQQDAPLEVVALALAVHVAEQEHAEDDRDHVPLREEQGEGVAGEVGVGVRGRQLHGEGGREEDEGGDLQQADLQRVGRTDLHRECNVAVHSERDGVLGSEKNRVSNLEHKSSLHRELASVWKQLQKHQGEEQTQKKKKRKPYQEFGRVGHERKESDTQELLVDGEPFEDHIHRVDEDLGNDGI